MNEVAVPVSDESLLARIRKGEEEALRLLIRRHERRLYAAALSLTRATWDAEEVVGMAYLELWRKRDRVRIVDGSALPWLLRVTSFAAKNQLRGARRYRRLLARVPAQESIPDHADEVARMLDQHALSTDLTDALEAASPLDASVILLCLVEELSTLQAAEVLDVPEGTVKSRLSRAKARLRMQLKEHAQEHLEASA